MKSICFRALNRVRDISRWHLEVHILKVCARPKLLGPIEQTRDWVIPQDRLARGAICYCAGVGEDIGLELHLIAKYGVHVLAFDPTPRSKAFMASLSYDRSKLQYYEYGLWSRNEVLKFYAPDNAAHVSHSVLQDNAHGQSYFEAQCKTVSRIMAEHGHTRVDLLKMNIEGAEHYVLGNLIQDSVRPGVIMLTFEGKHALWRALQWTRRLRRNGYELVGLKKWAATFIDAH